MNNRKSHALKPWACLLAALLFAFAFALPARHAAAEDATDAAADLSVEADGGNASAAESDLENIVELGTAYCSVRTDGGVETVLTSALTLGGVSPEYALAVVWAPSSGKAALRKSATAKGTFIKDCAAGTLVVVLSLAGDYTKIDYLGKKGYVRTDCLRFFPAAAQAAPTGVLSYNGYANGATTVNVRLEGDRKSRKIGAFNTGTPLTVITPGETWTEIEVKGLRGFVMTRYVTVLTEPESTATPAP